MRTRVPSVRQPASTSRHTRTGTAGEDPIAASSGASCSALSSITVIFSLVAAPARAASSRSAGTSVVG
jgi:hypothetical protein